MTRLIRLGLAPLALAVWTGLALAGPFFTGLKVYIGQKNWEKACTVCPQAIDQDGDNPDVFNKCGIAFAEVDSLQRAGQLFQQGVELANKNKDTKMAADIIHNRDHYYSTLFNKGLLLLKDGGDILDSLGSHADTTKPAVRAAMGSARDKFVRAASETQKAAMLSPKDERVWAQLGVAYSRSDREADALAAYKKALEINPDYDIAKQNMRGTMIRAAEKYKGSGKYQEAAGVFEGLWKEGDTTSLQDLGDIYYGMAKAAGTDTAAANSGYRKSAGYYGQFYQYHPADTVAEYNYVVALLNARDYATAQGVAKRIVTRNPMLASNHSLLRDTFVGGAANTSMTMGEKLAEDALTKGKEVPAAALKPAAATDAGKVIARMGKPERVYQWTDSNFTCSVYFYLAKGEVYGFIADKQVGKSSWMQ